MDQKEIIGSLFTGTYIDQKNSLQTDKKYVCVCPPLTFTS